MPLGAEVEVPVLATPVRLMLTVAVPLDPEPSVANAVIVTVPGVLPALKNPAESMTPFPVSDHFTGTFAVNCRLAPSATVAVEGVTNTIVVLEPPQDNRVANRQHNGIRTTAFFNPALREKDETKDETKLLGTRLSIAEQPVPKDRPGCVPDGLPARGCQHRKSTL
jgi:hypothetical protein